MNTLFLFLGFLTFLAIFTYGKVKSSVNLTSKSGYFLAGRSLTGVIIAASILLTNLSTEQIIGQNGQSYKFSMEIMSWETGAVFSIICMAIIFLPRYLKSGITTVPEFLELRYSRKVRIFISIMIFINYLFAFLPTVLYSGALVFIKIFNIQKILGLSEVPTLYLVVGILTIFGATLVLWGGLKAATVIDSVTSVLFLIGMLIVPLFAFYKLGMGDPSEGLKKMLEENSNKLNSIGANDSPLVPFPTIFLGLFFNNLFYWCTNQAIIQRTFASRSLEEGQKGVIFAGYLKLIGPLFLALPGVIAYTFNPSLSNADEAYPYLMTEVLEPILISFLGIVLFGSLLSTFNNILNSLVTISSVDLYRTFSKKERSDKDIISKARVIGILLTVISIAIAPQIMKFPQGLYIFLQLLNSYVSMPLLAAVLLGIYSRKVSAHAMIIGFIFYIIFWTAYIIFASHINLLWMLTFAFPLLIFIIYIASYFYPNENKWKIEDVKSSINLEPWKYRWHSITALLILLIVIYTLFSPIGTNFLLRLFQLGYKVNPNTFFISIVSLVFVFGAYLHIVALKKYKNN